MRVSKLLPEKSTENAANGWVNGFIGVLIFSGSLPATRLAVMDFAPLFLTAARATIAGLLALCMLLIFKEKRPEKAHLIPLVIVSIGVVVGFPLLTALALQYVTSAHSIVFVGMLPLTTAIFGVIRGGERPRPVFWVFSILGSLLVAGCWFCHGTRFVGIAHRRCYDAAGNYFVRTWLCRRCETFKIPRRMAGDFLGIGDVIARYGSDDVFLLSVWHHRYWGTGVDRFGICFTVQYADRIYILVSGFGAGRHCCCGSVTAIAALFWTGAGGYLIA